jgi:transcriptional regulator with XRE-family HTH domain
MFDGSLVKQLRLRNNLTEHALAALLGVSRSYISHIEAGKRKPKLDHQKKLAEIFGVPIHAFYRESKPVPEVRERNMLHEENTESVSNQSHAAPMLVLSVPMLLSMVNGVQMEIKDTACSGQRFHGTRNIQGRLEGELLDPKTDSFDLTVKATEVVLWLRTSNEFWWEEHCHPYCEKPAMLLYETETSLAEEYGVGLVWFTAYSSEYNRLLTCVEFKNSTPSVQVLDSELKQDLLTYEAYQRGRSDG